MTTVITSDLSVFTPTALDHMQTMISLYRHGRLGDVAYKVMSNNIRIQFNTESCVLFMSDEDLNTFVLSGDHPPRLLYMHHCADCGNEGVEGAYTSRPGCRTCIQDKQELGL